MPELPVAAQPSPLLVAALAYADRGWPVLACHSAGDGGCTCGKGDCTSPGKHPRVEHGLKGASTDDALIRSWWTKWPAANIGVVTGAASGLVVLDVDPDHGGQESLADLVAKHGRLPETPESLTGGGGYHLLFQYPGRPVRNSSGKLGPGLDIRADGGYIVAPPSHHVSGTAYAWDVARNPDTMLAPMPAWLLGLVTDKAGADGHRAAERIGEIIAEGQRNTTLASLGGSLRRRGASEAGILAALEAENARCRPPLQHDELARIATSLARYAAGPALVGRNGDEPAPEGEAPGAEASSPFARTDCGNGELLAALYGDRLRYDWRRGRWLAWAGHWWTEDVEGRLVELGKRAARHRYHAAISLPDADERKREASWALGSESRQRVESAWWAARAEPPIADKGDGWDSDPFTLGVGNGLLDLRHGTLRPGRQSDRVTMHTKIAFDPAATCPRWLRFLKEVFEGDADLIEFIQRYVGYSLTADTSDQSLILCHGAGANGKDVFQSTLRAVLGSYAYNAPFSTFELYARPAIPNDLAALAGRRLVTAAETLEGTRLNEARIKALTGCDVVTARFLHGEFFQFRPVGKFWLACNHRPLVKDDSFAFWRRIRLVPFTRTFKEDADPHLTEKLAGELPGILAWAVDGCIRWQADGLRPPPAVLAATKEYEEESDPVAAFIGERCAIADQCTAPAGRLYAAYRGWAEDQGMQGREVLTATMFGKKMAGRFERSHARMGWGYRGVGLLADGFAAACDGFEDAV